jgi:polyhydroxybutyrate depolymerase
MKGVTQKILLAGLLMFIGVPLAAVLVASVAFWMLDKANGTIVSSGLTRRYLLYVPPSYDRSQAAPLVISIHPAATWPAVQMAISRWNELADQYGFIVVYPAGSGAFFGGLGPGPQVWPAEEDTLGRDVKFISDLLDKLETEYHLDRNRIFVNGMSNGGGMAFLLSCELPDRIAAVGVVAGAFPSIAGHCANAKPVPTVVFHGTADKLAPYAGGKSPVAPRPFPSVPDWTARLARKNRCNLEPTDTRIAPDVRRLAYTDCQENADVVLYTLEGGGHTWPGGKQLAEWVAGRTIDDLSATKVMWEFFLRHSRGQR